MIKRNADCLFKVLSLRQKFAGNSLVQTGQGCFRNRINPNNQCPHDGQLTDGIEQFPPWSAAAAGGTVRCKHSRVGLILHPHSDKTGLSSHQVSQLVFEDIFQLVNGTRLRNGNG